LKVRIGCMMAALSIGLSLTQYYFGFLTSRKPVF
jgi:hypothetical protein